MQPSDVCRICGAKGLLLQISDEGTDYTEDIKDCLAVKVKADDGLSQEICHNCVGTLGLCKPYVSKIYLLKDNNSTPSSKKCYTCQSTKGHLFPFPDSSVDKLQKFFGLTVLKTKNSKICHECQYYLDCVSDFRDKASTASKISSFSQDLGFSVKKKNASVDDLVCSLKNREVEADELSQPRRASKNVKSSQIKSKGNGSTNNIVKEELSPKRRSKAKNSSAIEDDESDMEINRRKSHRQSVKESTVVDNDSPNKNAKGSGPKRRRLPSSSSDTDLNTSVETITDSKCKKLSGKSVNLSESRRSSRESNDSKTNELSKKSTKLKDSKDKSEPKLSPRSKRQKMSNFGEERNVESDSDSDSLCLASLANTDVKKKQLDETPKRSGRNKNIVKTSVIKVVEHDAPPKKPMGRHRKNAEAVGEKQSSRNTRNESEDCKMSKRVHFDEDSTKDNKKRKQAEQSKKRRAELSEESSDSEEALQVDPRRKKNPPLNAYTCTVCSDDFSSTVEGKEHELKHDERFNNFEIKLVRLVKLDIEEFTKKSSIKETSKNEDDEEDDLWSMRSALQENKMDNDGKENAFDALLDVDAEADKSSITKSLEPADSTKGAETTVSESSDSEFEDPNKDTSKTGKPDDTSETRTEDSKLLEVDEPKESPDSKPAEDDRLTDKEESTEKEEKNEAVSGEEKLETEAEEKADVVDTGSSNSTVAEPIDSSNSTVAEPKNGDLEGEEKVEEKDDSKEEDEIADEKVAESAPTEEKTELNGTNDNAEDIETQDKKEENTPILESSPVTKSGCTELPQPDEGTDNVKETVSEETNEVVSH